MDRVKYGSFCPWIRELLRPTRRGPVGRRRVPGLGVSRARRAPPRDRVSSRNTRRATPARCHTGGALCRHRGRGNTCARGGGRGRGGGRRRAQRGSREATARGERARHAGRRSLGHGRGSPPNEDESSDDEQPEQRTEQRGRPHRSWGGEARDRGRALDERTGGFAIRVARRRRPEARWTKGTRDVLPSSSLLQVGSKPVHRLVSVLGSLLERA